MENISRYKKKSGPKYSLNPKPERDLASQAKCEAIFPFFVVPR